MGRTEEVFSGFNPLIPDTEFYARVREEVRDFASASGRDADDDRITRITQLTDEESAERDAIVARIVKKLGLGEEIARLEKFNQRYRNRVAAELDTAAEADQS
jgi:hypothetical protein